MDTPNIPKELQTKVNDALQELCMYLHENVGSTTVLISLQHVSDAIMRQSSTSIAIMGGGLPILKDTPSNAPKNKEEVDKVIAELMAKAKAKQTEAKPEAKPEDPKP